MEYVQTEIGQYRTPTPSRDQAFQETRESVESKRHLVLELLAITPDGLAAWEVGDLLDWGPDPRQAAAPRLSELELLGDVYRPSNVLPRENPISGHNGDVYMITEQGREGLEKEAQEE
jgi:hypothetical protein